MAENKRMIVRQIRNSSAISRIGYNPLTQQLNILFNKGGRYPEYVFGGVEADLATRFMLSRSHGSFYHSNIKDNKAFRVGKPLGSFKLGAFGRRVRNVFRFNRG
jgi:hypothetical protein